MGKHARTAIEAFRKKNSRNITVKPDDRMNFSTGRLIKCGRNGCFFDNGPAGLNRINGDHPA
jgi:hypothetical protein